MGSADSREASHAFCWGNKTPARQWQIYDAEGMGVQAWKAAHTVVLWRTKQDHSVWSRSAKGSAEDRSGRRQRR